MVNKIEIFLKKYEQNYVHHNICTQNYHRQTDYLIAYLTILGAICYNMLPANSFKSTQIIDNSTLEGALILSVFIFFFLMSTIMDALFGIYRLSSILEVIENRINDLSKININCISIFMNQLHRNNKYSPALTWGVFSFVINVVILSIHIYLCMVLESIPFTFKVIYIAIIILIDSLMTYQWLALKRNAKKYVYEIEKIIGDIESESTEQPLPQKAS